MSEIWNEEAIGKVCSKVSLMGIPPFYVTAPDKMEGVSWIIAPYRDLLTPPRRLTGKSGEISATITTNFETYLTNLESASASGGPMSRRTGTAWRVSASG